MLTYKLFKIARPGNFNYTALCPTLLHGLDEFRHKPEFGTNRIRKSRSGGGHRRQEDVESPTQSRISLSIQRIGHRIFFLEYGVFLVIY